MPSWKPVPAEGLHADGHASRALQTKSFTVVMVEDAMNCLRRAVGSFLRRGKITNSLSALTRFYMCCRP